MLLLEKHVQIPQFFLSQLQHLFLNESLNVIYTNFGLAFTRPFFHSNLQWLPCMIGQGRCAGKKRYRYGRSVTKKVQFTLLKPGLCYHYLL